jgi:hypothetical protein
VARQRGTISALLQLGQQSGRMMGIFLPSIKPDVPVFDDTAERLVWHFGQSFAEGTDNDELYIAFA